MLRPLDLIQATFLVTSQVHMWLSTRSTYMLDLVLEWP